MIQSHKAAKPFRNQGFRLLNKRHCFLQGANQLLPIALKRQLYPHRSQAPLTALQVCNSDSTPLANLQQLSHAANEINVSSHDPNSIPPLTPSSFFAPSTHPHPPPLKCIFAADQCKLYEMQVGFSRGLRRAIMQVLSAHIVSSPGPTSKWCRNARSCGDSQGPFT